MAATRRHLGRLAGLVVLLLAAPALAPVPSTGQPSSAGQATSANPWLGRRVLSIAHAGGENEAPHETLFAYERAHALGTDVLEMDVRLTGDGVLVVHHDADVDATTDGTGLVADKTYAELFALDHGYKFTLDRWSCGSCPEEDYVYRGVRTGAKPPPDGYEADDFTIPTLEKLFETFGDTTYYDIEVKDDGPRTSAAVAELARLIEAHGLEDRTIVVAFDQDTVEEFRTLLPEVDTSPGVDGVQQFFFDRKPQPDHEILQVPPTYTLEGTTVEVVTPQFVADAHAAGLAVWVWMNGRSQENAEFYAALIDMGVDGILGAAPSVARDLIDQLGVGWDGTDPAPTTSTTAPPADPAPATAPGAVAVPASPDYTG